MKTRQKGRFFLLTLMRGFGSSLAFMERGLLMDPLETVSKIVQVLSALWALVFGSKSIIDVVRSIQKGQALKINPFIIVTVVLAIVLFLILSPAKPGPVSRDSRPDVNVTPSVGNLTTAPQTSTPPLKTMTFNRQLAGTNNCDSPVIKITIVSFTFDTGQSRTTLRLLLNAQRNYTQCRFDDASTTISGFNLQDSTGKTYEADGQLKGGGSFSLAAGQPLEQYALYSFLPSPGAVYTLPSLRLWCYEGMNLVGPIYETAQFTF